MLWLLMTKNYRETMGHVKNTRHRELHLKYMKLCHKIECRQHDLQMCREEYWDMWMPCDKDVWERAQAQEIRDIKEMLKDLHKECVELKREMIEANREWQIALKQKCSS